jgi:hypothetical protein
MSDWMWPGKGLDSRKAFVEHLGIGDMREGVGDHVSFTIFLDLLLAVFLALPEEEACLLLSQHAVYLLCCMVVDNVCSFSENVSTAFLSFQRKLNSFLPYVLHFFWFGIFR